MPILSLEDKQALSAQRGYKSPFRLPIRSTRASYLAIWRLILSHIEASSQPLRILDVGCGSGAMLQHIAEYYKEQGWPVNENLLGLDIDEEFFQAEVPFQKANLNLPLNQQVESFDVIIIMDVLEHLHSPYVMLGEIYQSLSSGGCLLFSVPNVHNIIGRLGFLLRGRHYKYPLPSIDPPDAVAGHGHINPFSVQYWDYGLRHAGFSDVHYLTDRMTRGALVSTVLLSPLLWLGTWSLHRKERRRNRRIYEQNHRAVNEINTLRNLAGCNLIGKCTKPSSDAGQTP